ncbi:UDP-glucuronosyltransferase 2B15-like [Ostrinia furnacalis]|uniref:UDP-glucuronosyltransferase 2B15-like n=1 Tax=Ostrinia furnacalis TaxID=93504 RepID=UPI001039D319|nr:UDP-glucuronosyltransferase 2B15-like [Ostrinia furnacalis]
MASVMKVLLLISIVLVQKHEGARILAVFPIPSISHQVVFRPLLLELAQRGHDVTVVTPDPVFTNEKSPANYTEIDVHERSYKTWRENFLSDAVTSGDREDLQTQMHVAFSTINKVFEMQLLTPKVQKLIKDKNQNFDLLIVEACPLVALGLTHVIKAPAIQMSSFGAFMHNIGTMGMPNHPIVHPTSVRQRVHNLTIWEKAVEIYNHIRLYRTLALCEEESDEMLRRVLGSDIPKLSELRNNVDFLFLNVHPIWELNRPSPPNVIYMGGLHQKPVKELPKDLKSYLDSSKHGLIYISFGTNVEPALLPPERIQKLINVFSKLPYDVLWKWNKDELPGRTENIRISKWLPQSDLLRHPKVKLFITQGGLQSTDEAITAGVPLIGIPMLGDQWYNVEQYAYHKIGLQLDMETLTEEKLDSAIRTILNDESTYRKNVAKLRTLMQDQPDTPLERAVWWTEYAIRHSGARHLRSPSANVSWYDYFELELAAYLIFALLTVLSAIVFVGYLLFSIFGQYKASIKIKRS